VHKLLTSPLHTHPPYPLGFAPALGGGLKPQNKSFAAVPQQCGATRVGSDGARFHHAECPHDLGCGTFERCSLSATPNGQSVTRASMNGNRRLPIKVSVVPIVNHNILHDVFASRVPASGCGRETPDLLFACENGSDGPHPLKNSIFIVLATVSVRQRLCIPATPNIKYFDAIFVARYGLWNHSKTIDLVWITATSQGKCDTADNNKFFHNYLRYCHDTNTSGSDCNTLRMENSDGQRVGRIEFQKVFKFGTKGTSDKPQPRVRSGRTKNLVTGLILIRTFLLCSIGK